MAKKFNSLLERFLVFLTTSSFMFSIIALSTSLFNKIEMNRILINWGSFIILGLSGLIFLLIQQIFVKEKIKNYLHIVVIVFYEIAAVFLCWLIGQLNLPYILIPFLLIEYVISYTLNNLFVYHDIFINECGNLSGKELETHLFHNNLAAIDFSAKCKVATALLLILPLVLFLWTFTVLKTGHKISFTAICFVMIFLISEFFIFFISGIYKNDVFFGFLGIRNFLTDKRRLLRSVLLILCGAFIFALFISSDNALIKIRMRNRPASQATIRTIPNGNIEEPLRPNPFEDLEKILPLKKSKIPEWVFDLIYGIISWGAVAALSICVIIFFLKPFFSAHWKQYWKEGRFLKYLRHILSEIKAFFNFRFKKDYSKIPYSSVQGQIFGQEIKNFLKKAGRSKEKNEEIDRLTKYFMRLIDWGEAHKISYKTNLAPAEYTSLIENQFNMPEAKKAGLLFEKALYDKNVLTADEERAFVEAVKKIIETVIQAGSENQES